MAERSAVNAPDRCDISHPRPGRSFGGVGGDHASTVLALWLEEPVEPPVEPNAWREQRDRVLTAAKAGHWFGTISSEPGGGGDLMATRATAKKEAMAPGA